VRDLGVRGALLEELEHLGLAGRQQVGPWVLRLFARTRWILRGQWQDSGTKGLVGDDELRQVLDGSHPVGCEPLVRPGRNRVPGFDLTFSAYLDILRGQLPWIDRHIVTRDIKREEPS
jgi:hypothetical protein